MAKNTQKNINSILWITAATLSLLLIFARAIYPELVWLGALLGVSLLGVFGFLVKENQKALKSRTAAYGLNSLVTVLLVIGIVGVLNFLASRYPQKLDLTKNKTNTLAEQSVKLVKGLKEPVKATFFSRSAEREQFRTLLNNFKSLNPKFELEYVDSEREFTRIKQANIKKHGTLVLAYGTRETRVEEITEEKITNALIKVLKEKVPTLCVITGHGERNFSGSDPEGYEIAKKSLIDQSYEIKELNLLQETQVPDTCAALAIIGPNKDFFDPEAKAIGDYLERGGRAVIALDLNLKGSENGKQLFPILQAWHIQPAKALIVDPLSRMMGQDSSVAMIPTFSKEHPITRDFSQQCAFPLSRPLEIIPGAPNGLMVQWIAQTHPKSLGAVNLEQLSKGEVRLSPGKDKTGPLNVAVAVEGKQKDSKATKSTRLVVLGSSFFATNNFSRFGGNLDFFLNAVSWTMEDDNLISIRAKEDEPSKIEISEKMGIFIVLFIRLVLPILVAASGLGIWLARKKL